MHTINLGHTESNANLVNFWGGGGGTRKLIKLETRQSVPDPDRVKWDTMMQTEGKMVYGCRKN